MITREDIEKAFDEKVEYRLCSWREDKGIRRPTLSEIKQRLLALADSPAPTMNVVGPDLRSLAVEIVDGVRGYTYEFSRHPSAHAADYDLVEEKLRAALSSRAKR